MPEPSARRCPRLALGRGCGSKALACADSSGATENGSDRSGAVIDLKRLGRLRQDICLVQLRSAHLAVRLAIEGRSACDQRVRAFCSSEGPRLGGATANPEPPMILFELDHFGSIIAVATATLKLPNRRRIVFSDGRMAASVQLSAVGIEPCSATNLRRAATASATPSIDSLNGELAGAGSGRH